MIADFLPDATANDGQLGEGSRASVLIDLIATEVELHHGTFPIGGNKADGNKADRNSAGQAQYDHHDVNDVVRHFTSQFPELSRPELRSRLSERLSRLSGDDVDDAYATQYEDEGLSSETANDRHDHSSSSEPVPDDEGQAASRYRRLAEHARGGMGVVWRVEDRKLGREIAWKQLPSSPVPSERTRERFVAEARVTAQLEHPGIVPIYDLTHLDDGQPSYTMKLLRGETLTAAIGEFHKIPPKSRERTLARQKLIDAFLSVCQTIAYAHSHKVLHRDLKPDNIHLGEFGETAVLDWGLAKSLATQEAAPGAAASEHVESSGGDVLETLPPVDSGSNLATRQGELLGTPAYMAPEQAQGRSATEATDRYGLGAVLYQILTGTPPHSSEDLSSLLTKITHDEVAPPLSRVTDTPKPLDAICLKLLSKAPEDRYSRTTDIVADLNRITADEAVSCAQENLSDRLFRWMRKHQSWVVAGIASIVFVAATVVASLLIASANQAREFAQQQRLQQIRSAAELADAVSTTQIQNDDFEAAIEVVKQGISRLAGISELDQLRAALEEKLDRATRLQSFNRMLRKHYHYTVNQETHSTYRSAKQCLSILDLDVSKTKPFDWTQDLPDKDLAEAQQIRLREQVHDLIFKLASMRAFAGMGELTRQNLNENIFTVMPTDDLTTKFESAERYLEHAEQYRTTTAARYIRSIVEMGKGDVVFVEWLADFFAMEPGEPESATDCFNMAVIYVTFDQTKETFKPFLSIAEAAGTKSKLGEARAEAQRLFEKAVRLDPRFYPAMYQLAFLEGTTGNYKCALARFDSCIQLDPEGPEAYSGRASTMFVQKSFLEKPESKQEVDKLFQADLAKAVELGGEFGKVLQEIGFLRCVDGQMETGARNMLDGLDLSTNRVTSNFWNPDDGFDNLLQIIRNAGANPDDAPEWMQLVRATNLVDLQKSLDALPHVIEFPEDHPAYHRALAVRIIVACSLVRGDPPDWTKVHDSLTEEKLLDWSRYVTTEYASYYRGWQARLELLGKLGRYPQRLTDVETALKVAKLKDWQRFELLWFKADCLDNLDRSSEADAVRAEAKALSEIYYEHFASRSGSDETV